MEIRGRRHWRCKYTNDGLGDSGPKHRKCEPRPNFKDEGEKDLVRGASRPVKPQSTPTWGGGKSHIERLEAKRRPASLDHLKSQRTGEKKDYASEASMGGKSVP